MENQNGAFPGKKWARGSGKTGVETNGKRKTRGVTRGVLEQQEEN